MTEVKINELEKKVELLAKAVGMMMEGEELSEEEIRSRLNDWLKGSREELPKEDFPELWESEP